MIGVGLVAFITIFVSSTKASLNENLDHAFTGDIAVESGAGLIGGIDPSLTERLNTIPQVESATGLRRGVASIAGTVDYVSGLDLQTASGVFSIGPIAGSTDALGPTAIGVQKDTAKERDLKVGDLVQVAFKDTGMQTLQVALIYGQDQPIGNYLLGMQAYNDNFATHYDTQVFVKRAAGVSTAAALAAVKQAAKAYPGVTVLDRDGFKNAQAEPLNRMLALIYALLGLAVIIALLGIANTLALSIFERTREIGLLRAVGMTRSQLRSVIRWESVIIALQGTALGLAIGVFFGRALVKALGDEGITVFRLPAGGMAVIVLLAAVAGMVAAIGRAAALPSSTCSGRWSPNRPKEGPLPVGLAAGDGHGVSRTERPALGRAAETHTSACHRAFNRPRPGDNQAMNGMPPETLYHRLLGWHAPAMRRAGAVFSVGLIMAAVLATFVAWELAALGGWDAAALAFLGTVWPIIIRADGFHTEHLAMREDETRGTAILLLVGASTASLFGVGFALDLAGRRGGGSQALLIGVTMLTVVLSWTVINTLFTLRYADLHFRSAAAGIGFEDAREARPTYRDFAYVAFTIGMTYQVSDTTVHDPRIRGTVLSHALLSYVFGVVIVAGSVSLIAGLVA
jgi:uncharacterized membrane protein